MLDNKRTSTKAKEEKPDEKWVRERIAKHYLLGDTFMYESHGTGTIPDYELGAGQNRVYLEITSLRSFSTIGTENIIYDKGIKDFALTIEEKIKCFLKPGESLIIILNYYEAKKQLKNKLENKITSAIEQAYRKGKLTLDKKVSLPISETLNIEVTLTAYYSSDQCFKHCTIKIIAIDNLMSDICDSSLAIQATCPLFCQVQEKKDKIDERKQIFWNNSEQPIWLALIANHPLLTIDDYRNAVTNIGNL